MQSLSYLISRHGFSGRIATLRSRHARGSEPWRVNVGSTLTTVVRTNFATGERLLCSASEPPNADEKEVNVTRKKKAKKERVDTPYVLRRTEYLKKIGALRKDFIEQVKADRSEEERIKTEKYQQKFIDAELRMQRRRYVQQPACFVLNCSSLQILSN